ncbi:hypothetical protein VTO42DRAFT_156 [Malbranchea cinnamomea]
MDFDHPLPARSIRNPFRRCVVNCPTTIPPCPVCAEDERCITIAQSCDECAKTICAKKPGASSDEGSGGNNAGPIAGGVVGGVILIAILCLALWFYSRRRKRLKAELENQSAFEKQDDYAGHERVARSRVASMASTVMTRASNVIPIAYIPGVTNRSAPQTPATLAPPVPPIPGGADQHYFLPGDLRDSVWSEMSDDYRKSLSPSLARSSVATTIYRNNAVVSPVPAQQAMRGKANVISVKSGHSSPGTSTPGSSTPAVPAITAAQLDKAQQNTLGVSSIVARSVVARPINVTKPRSKLATSSEQSDQTSVPTVTVETVPDSDGTTDTQPGVESQAHGQSAQLKGKQHESTQSAAVTVIEDSPAVKQSPFADPESPVEKQDNKPTATSSAIPEEMSRQSIDSKRNSSHRHRTSHGSGKLLQEADAPERSTSPFSDENEVK